MAIPDVRKYQITEWEHWHEWHNPVSVTAGELFQDGFFNITSEGNDWTWDSYSEEQDARLREMIVDRYWDRDIGILPPGKWKRQFIERMREIMPKYVILYRLVAEEPSLLGATSEYYKSRNIFSDFPQTQLGGNSDYASTGNDTEFERIRQLDLMEIASRLKDYQNVDSMVLDELEDLFSCLVSVTLDTR